MYIITHVPSRNTYFDNGLLRYNLASLEFEALKVEALLVRLWRIANFAGLKMPSDAAHARHANFPLADLFRRPPIIHLLLIPFHLHLS